VVIIQLLFKSGQALKPPIDRIVKNMLKYISKIKKMVAK